MNNWNGFCQGMIVAIFTVWVLVLAVNYIGRATNYEDRLIAQRMNTCQNNGYTFGDCYNTIISNIDKFSK